MAVLQHIKRTVGLNEMSVSEKHFTLSIDEMKIRSGLVFRKSTGELVGFCSPGEANNDLERLTESLTSGSKGATPQLASQVLVFMVRHIFKPSMFFPVAMNPSNCLSGERLYPLVFDVTEALELQGFPVVSITSDGNSPNRRFYRICGLSDEQPTYKTINPFANDRNIYFFCDPPHLLKTVRNCFSNSFSHSRTRTLWVGYKQVYAYMYMFLSCFVSSFFLVVWCAYNVIVHVRVRVCNMFVASSHCRRTDRTEAGNMLSISTSQRQRQLVVLGYALS